ncbi:hypothetical protein BGP76_08105 [Reichenbachiella sp. MSK19-1]|nr:hypothetical protein BGP76_08105 [Reichenbachiella sp. MSK19-1]
MEKYGDETISDMNADFLQFIPADIFQLGFKSSCKGSHMCHYTPKKVEEKDNKMVILHATICEICHRLADTEKP